MLPPEPISTEAWMRMIHTSMQVSDPAGMFREFHRLLPPDWQQIPFGILCEDGPQVTLSFGGAILESPSPGSGDGLFNIVGHPPEPLLGALEVLCDHAGKLEIVAETDGLTGVGNHRGFEAHAERALAVFLRHGIDAGLLFFDVQNFKAWNDREGHAAGDDLLRRIARLLQGQIRTEDYCARIGGDEFVVLLRHVESVDPRAVASRLAQAVYVHCGRPLHQGGVLLSSLPENQRTLSHWLTAAENATDPSITGAEG